MFSPHLRCKHSFRSRNIWLPAREYGLYRYLFALSEGDRREIALRNKHLSHNATFRNLGWSVFIQIHWKASNDGDLKSWHDTFIYLSSRFYPVLSSAPAEVRSTHWVGHFFCLLNGFLCVIEPLQGYHSAPVARLPSVTTPDQSVADDKPVPAFLPGTDSVKHRNCHRLI